jgi:hypothetical protein
MEVEARGWFYEQVSSHVDVTSPGRALNEIAGAIERQDLRSRAMVA